MLDGRSVTSKLLFSPPLKNFLMSFKVQLTISYSIVTTAMPTVSTHKDLGIVSYISHHKYIISKAYIIRPGQVDSQFIVPTHMCF